MVRNLITAISLGDVPTKVYFSEHKIVQDGVYMIYAQSGITKSTVQKFALHCFITSATENLQEERFFIRREELQVLMGTRSQATIYLPLAEVKLGYADRYTKKINWREYCAENGWNLVKNLIAESRSG